MKINEIVRRMEPRHYTRGDAARLVGRSPDTLRQWKRDGTYLPSDTKRFGGLSVDLYSEEDITAMKRLIGGKKRIAS